MRLLQAVYAVVMTGLVATLIVLLVIYAGLDDEAHPPPHGCAWLDMAPGKSADYHLACVPGYFP